MATALDTESQEIELWKIKKLVQTLDSYKGNGTSMISIYIPPNTPVSPMQSKLTDELGAAQNIKSRVNRQSVITAITSVQQKLKLYYKAPPNGLVVFCGEITTDDGKEKKVNIDFEPFKPINHSLYLCDNKFHTEAISALLVDDSKFGFIIMDGHGALFGTLQGNTRDTLTKYDVDLPKKHGRGGQSALRFARLRLEKRHNYVRKVAETAVTCFITNDKVNVAGIILAGSADFKTELGQSDMFDQRLQAKILKVVDISYGGETGFNQAIELASDCLQGVKFIQEKRTIGEFLDEVGKDSGLYCFGADETVKLLESGAIKTLIVWESLEITKYTIKMADGEKKVIYIRPNQEEKLQKIQKDSNECEIQEQVSLLDWLVENYKSYGAKLQIVTDKTQEGSQFCKGFGGIGGLLRYQLESNNNLFDNEDDLNLNDIDYDDY